MDLDLIIRLGQLVLENNPELSDVSYLQAPGSTYPPAREESSSSQTSSNQPFHGYQYPAPLTTQHRLRQATSQPLLNPRPAEPQQFQSPPTTASRSSSSPSAVSSISPSTISSISPSSISSVRPSTISSVNPSTVSLVSPSISSISLCSTTTAFSSSDTTDHQAQRLPLAAVGLDWFDTPGGYQGSNGNSYIVTVGNRTLSTDQWQASPSLSFEDIRPIDTR
ncbi:hypothetical protein JAAARDRAFT_198053 [Jaapia argillacea MUCL 33604]|uniref:Uncharacterized protein n=1 Tax=Jaapia argillacea MUCL 33604 TaxID=933084 RepID=A0A067PQW5_9AGAM|nr:hypothetical protein JAAARDRAFT_198053 [Jaapia argillacea MUCL 33604]